MANLNFFKKERVDLPEESKLRYKILVVDDDESIHQVTNFALEGMHFSDFNIEILTAYSAQEARDVLMEHDDVALALVDVVMETPEAGLDLVNYIRKNLQNKMIRLIIRTGQANNFPEMEVTQQYDINDFKEKTELTVEKLFITVRTSIKQYEQLLELKEINKNLDKRVKEEIEKNREKDKIMLEQSKLAQMGELLSMIAHQWRQPLSTISAVSSSLQVKLDLGSFDVKDQTAMDKTKKEFANKLHDIGFYVENLSRTIEDFRNFHKPNKELVKSTFEEIVKKSVHIINASLQSENIELIEEYSNQTPIEVFDRELMQVILNILKNAQDHFREKGVENKKIYIHASGNELKISNNGGGIPEHIIDKIFEPYFSTKNEKNGTGLGLYMSKTIVEKHHKGQLSVMNENDGASFIIRL